MKRIAFYGGSFDPVHRGHMAVAEKLAEVFELDEFVFIPAFHAPHKLDRKPTSAFHRYAMLCLATSEKQKVKVSTIELELPEKPFTVETLERLKSQFPEDHIFFVMGADSWQDIQTWREWEKVLLMTNHIIVARPGYEMDFSHVTDEVRKRIVDLREGVSGFKSQGSSRERPETLNLKLETNGERIYITDAVSLDISATDIRNRIRDAASDRQKDVPDEVAKYIEKYQIYK